MNVNAQIAENPLDQSLDDCAIIIPFKDNYEYTIKCLHSIFASTLSSSLPKVYLVDNNSENSETLDAIDKAIKEYSANVKLLSYDRPFNFSAINNFAVKHANGEVLVLLNNDIEILTPDWLEEMVSNALRGDIGCVGSKLYYPNGQIQHAGVVTGIGGVAGHGHKHFAKEHAGHFKRLMISQNYSAVTAACLAVRKSVFEEVGGLNEQDLTVAFNDVDFCLRVQELGYRNLWTPYAEMIHHESISRGHEDTPEKQARFNSEVSYMKTRWGEQLNQDPCYSPWLTLVKEDFTFR